MERNDVLLRHDTPGSAIVHRRILGALYRWEEERRRKTRQTIWGTCVVLMTIGSLIFTYPNIRRWEKSHNYPFGQMCYSVFTMWVNTCPR